MVCSLLLSLWPFCFGLWPGSPEDLPQRMAWLGGLGRGNEKKRGGKWGRPEAEVAVVLAHVLPTVWVQKCDTREMGAQGAQIQLTGILEWQDPK